MDQKDDSMFADAGHVNGTSEGGTTDPAAVSEADPPAAERAEGVAAGLRPGFLAELAVAMRSTAEKERERISGKVSDDAEAHVEKVRARAAIETDELKRLAEEDVQHIEEWAVSEMERIRGEADRKIEDRRASLEEYLKQHDTIIDTEIDGVNAAVRDYNTTLDRYFEELAQSDDPASIVARAEALPAPPDLDQVRAQARARAVSMFAEREEDAPPTSVAQAPSVAEVSGEAPDIETPMAAAPAVAGSAVAASAAVAPTVEAPAGEALMAETTMAEVGAVAEESAPVAESSIEAEPVATASAETADVLTEPASSEPVIAEAMAEPVPAEMPIEAGLIGDTPPVAEPIAEPMAEPVAAAEVASPEPEPVPVMDPAATSKAGWPAPAPEPEREPVAASVDHTSAAVRLLRSVAPWTAPTHAGTNDKTDSE